MYLPAMQILINVLLDQYFSQSRCIFFISDDYNSNIIPSTPKQFVNIVVKNGMLDGEYVLRNYGCKDIIIATNEPASVFKQFEKIIIDKENVNERYNDRKYIVFVPAKSISQDKIFEYEDVMYVSNLLVIEEESIRKEKFYKFGINIEDNSDVVFTFYTNKFIGVDKFNEKVFLDKWFSQNQTFLEGKNLFPDKLADINGRPLRLAGFTYEPYVIYDVEKQIYDGIETVLCREYASQLNATPEYVEVSDGYYWGYMYDNGTGAGLAGYIHEDKADIGFAGEYRWIENYPFMDFTATTLKGGITMYVPGPRLANGWLLPAYSFSAELWAVAVFTFFVSSIFLWWITIVTDRDQSGTLSIRLLDNYITILFTTIRVFLEQPLLGMYKTGIYKFFMLFIILQTLLLSFFYNSGLASIMTIPRYVGIIKTVQDFADSDLTWVAPSDAWIQSISSSDQEKYKIIISNFVKVSSENAMELGKLHTFAFPIERLQYGHYAVQEYHTKEMVPYYRLIKENLYWDYCVFIIRKHSVYYTSLNKLIMSLYESGILAIWENYAVAKYMDLNMQNLMNFYSFHKEMDTGIVVLSWKHVQGSVALLILGLCISTVCFVFEIFIYRRQSRTAKLIST